jgi:hypothetical protein
MPFESWMKVTSPLTAVKNAVKREMQPRFQIPPGEKFIGSNNAMAKHRRSTGPQNVGVE